VIYSHDGSELTKVGLWLVSLANLTCQQPLGQKEGIVYADVQLHTIDYSKYLADRVCHTFAAAFKLLTSHSQVGHYSRPDLHWLGVNTNPNPFVRYEQPSQPSIPTQLDRFKPLSSLPPESQPQSKAKAAKEEQAQPDGI
jgi:hypothetical protein